MTRRSRLAQEVRWVRAEGLGRFLEEKEVHPVVGARQAAAAWRWRRANPRSPGTSRPVWVLGLQRSGTNMVMRALRMLPSAEVHNESDRRAFTDYRLRPDEVITTILERSRSDLVVFKPLCDSHRALELLDRPWPARPGRIVWTYRSMDARVRSAASRFGNAARDALVQIADGDQNVWQAGGLSEERLEVLERIPPRRLDPLSAQALWWYLRNSLFFDLGLDQRTDVHLLGYDDLVADPGPQMGRLCNYLGVEASLEMTKGMAARPARRLALQPIDPHVRALCGDLSARLGSVARRQEPHEQHPASAPA